MSARAPGEHVEEGETVQEHDLEDRRKRIDELASDQGQQSPTKPKAPTKRETWLDWMPDGMPEPDDLYTRDQIAEMATGIDPVTGDDIRYWEYQGVLPRSVRRRHEGATRAVYPEWYAGLVREVRHLQRHGLSLEEIKPRIRDHYEMFQVSEGSYSRLNPDPVLLDELNRVAGQLAKAQGSRVEHIEVSITFEDGSGVIAAYPVMDPTE